MTHSKVLPVIDLKRGQVVHGVAGKRDTYQPIVSQIVDSPHPGKVARAMCDSTGAREVYVADLDAIAGGAPDWNSYATIQNSGCELWLDAGTGDPESICRVVEKVDCRVIVALESLPSLRSLEKMVAGFSDRKLVFSLDLKDGLPMTRDPAASKLSAETVATFAIDAGITSMIVLDIAAVGSGTVSTVDLCRKIKARHLDMELTSGGGVRGIEDVERFVEAGCDRVLVATAIHDGSIRE